MSGSRRTPSSFTTLRVIPERFKSVLLDNDEDTLPRAAAWDLSCALTAAHPFSFTPRLDEAPDAPLFVREQTSRRQATIPGRSARPSPRAVPDGPARDAFVSHSADRLAGAIVLATHSPSDPRTLTSWGHQVGVSRGALRVWCKAAGTSARSCLDFLRVLRAVMLSSNQAWDLLSVLDVVDQRSLVNLLDRGGVRELCREKRPTVDEFMRCQRFLENRQVIQAVTRRLNTGAVE